jgi:methionyl aminopeptidase
LIVRNKHDLEGLRRIGKIVALTIAEMKAKVRPGMTTKELDDIGLSVLRRHGANSAPIKVYRFPGATCISLNDEVAHGIPGDRKIQPGDLINIDVSAELDGYYADAGTSFQIPPYDAGLQRLCEKAHDTMMNVIAQLRAGTPIRRIGQLMEQEAAGAGYRIIRNLCSHGIGRSLHEYPKEILPFDHAAEKRKLTEGLVITIEPFLSTGADYVVEDPDGWTLRTPDGSRVAQHEHTIVITKNKPIILTLPEE